MPSISFQTSTKLRGAGIEPTSRRSKRLVLPLDDPASVLVCAKVPCGSRTHLARLEAWNLCRSVKGTRIKKAPVGGVEPPIVGLTGRRLTIWPHRIIGMSYSYSTTKRPAGVEPALPAWQAGRLPLHHGRFLRVSSIDAQAKMPG